MILMLAAGRKIGIKYCGVENVFHDWIFWKSNSKTSVFLFFFCLKNASCPLLSDTYSTQWTQYFH